MQCKDKFLIQSTKVAASTDMDEIPPDTVRRNCKMCNLEGLSLHYHYNEIISIAVRHLVVYVQFNKDADKVIEEMKLKVVYTLPSGGSDDSSVSSLGSRSFKGASDDLTVRLWQFCSNMHDIYYSLINIQ
jgi:hypothetical protein